MDKLKDLINRPLRKMSIRTKETLLILIAMVVPLIFFAIVLNVVLRSYSRDLALHNLSGAIDSLTNSITEQSNTIYQDSILMLRDPNIRYLVQEPESAGLNAPYLDQKSNAVMLVDNLNEAHYISSISFYVTDVRNYLIDNNYFYMLSQIEEKPWFEKVTGSSRKGIWVDTSSEFKNSISYVTKVVYLSDYGKYNSILKIDYNVAYLKDMLNNSMISPASFCGIVDASDWHMLMLAEGSGGDDYKGYINLRAIAGKGFTKQKLGNDYYWIYATHIEKPDWFVVTAMPEAAFNMFTQVKSFLPIVLSVLAAWTVIIIISVLNISSMTARIQAISRHVKAMREGDETSLIPSFKNQDEITDLADNVNHLQMELKDNLERNYILGVAKKSSDLRALQAQINPHFLYNTLEMIDYYAFDNQPEIVEEIVAKLSKFYKLSLNNGKELYSLSEELTLVSSYFDIQALRFQGKIKLNVDIPPDILTVSIPPITLQPLVENSIIHGIREKEDKHGNIFITARREGEAVVISVKDDGIGIPNETLLKINTETLKLTGAAISSKHYGIRNISQRIKIMFGEEYGISVRNNEGTEGVTVDVKLPG
ncbi:MAG: histidine kinase [Lachnospiraceae bacterium]|nr:histidine kinase [Lachnospiraceae bacterium]